MACYCDYDICDISRVTRRTARKTWACVECGESIEPGDEYTEYASLIDGSWSTDRMCECCEADWERMIELGHCMLIGELEETIDEAYRYV